jgi:hypothetical protein
MLVLDEDEFILRDNKKKINEKNVNNNAIKSECDMNLEVGIAFAVLIVQSVIAELN